MESTVPTVGIAEVRSILNSVLDALEASGVEQVSIEDDAYWTIFFADAFDMTKQPEPVVGSLADDVDDLRGEMRALGNGDGVSLWHMFHHLGGVMQLMAEQSRLRSQ